MSSDDDESAEIIDDDNYNESIAAKRQKFDHVADGSIVKLTLKNFMQVVFFLIDKYLMWYSLPRLYTDVDTNYNNDGVYIKGGHNKASQLRD